MKKTSLLVCALILSTFTCAFAQSSYEEFVSSLSGKSFDESKEVLQKNNLITSKKSVKIIDGLKWDIYPFPDKGFSIEYYPDQNCSCGYLKVSPSSNVNLTKGIGLISTKTVQQLLATMGKPEQMRIVKAKTSFNIQADYAFANSRITFVFVPVQKINKVKDCVFADSPIYGACKNAVLKEVIMPVFKSEIPPLMMCEE